METTELILLYDYYGDLLTDRQRECFELRYYQDFSLGEIGQVLGVSRQGVHDNLNRTEALLRKMEENIGCVSRDLERRKALRVILEAAETLRDNHDETVSNLARAIIDACEGLEE